MHNFPFAKVYLGRLEKKYAIDAIKNGWGNNHSKYINLFENKFKSLTNTKYAIATSSCTGSLHLALMSLGIGTDDEVLVPEITWIASSAAINYVNAKPKFVNISQEDWCIDPIELEKNITKKTKALILVHLYGNVAKIDKIKQICNKHKIYLIEDCAESLGSLYKNKHLGTFGDVGVFSFNGTKTITTGGEGGMLVTNNKAIYKKALLISNHGRSSKDHNLWKMKTIGLKYKMTNVQAAIGLGQLERFDSIIKKKRSIFSYYVLKLKKFNFIFNSERNFEKNSYWLPVLINVNLNEKKRNLIIKEANKIGIGLRPFFYSLISFPMYKKYLKKNHSITTFFNKGICLPSYHELNKSDQDIIIDYIIFLFKKYKVLNN